MNLLLFFVIYDSKSRLFGFWLIMKITNLMHVLEYPHAGYQTQGDLIKA